MSKNSRNVWSKHEILREEIYPKFCSRRFYSRDYFSSDEAARDPSELQDQTEQRFVIEQRLSESTINRFLHSQLQMSYKKQSKINSKVMTPSGVAEVTKWAAVIKTLIDRGDEVLFIDEFSVNSRTH